MGAMIATVPPDFRGRLRRALEHGNKALEELGLRRFKLMPDTIHAIVEASEGRTYQSGQDVIVNGEDHDRGHEFYFLVSGKLVAFDGDTMGIFVDIGTYSFFGWHAITKKPGEVTTRQGTVSVPEDGEPVLVAVIDVRKIQGVLFDLAHFARFHSERMEGDAERVRQLIEMFERDAEDGPDGIVIIDEVDEAL